ncbi:coenzyme PQQ synthesis protein D [Nitratireductor aestuarii]|uniref:Coenzyme PQQ synthesis protein D n=1 Tax=Nitratireductor aestuarii TaxID=1735103 RepID=A0A916RZ30_9HYPH|nr:pyrroloquinoline quinone biosynthesis peptide chaperone PqqD [Nitratireductor aestuarii]GGA77787.1 coenzyme PQQ synthesis protein D [Nitratireductor aestuarii]
MSAVPARTLRLELTDASRPRLARHARLKFDKVRELWVLLVPERVLVPDETAIEILNLCDGERSIEDVVDLLSEKYAADRELIRTDVIALLQDLADKGYLINAAEEKS